MIPQPQRPRVVMVCDDVSIDRRIIREALTLIDQAGGQVATHGEIWQATAADAIPSGSRVRILRIDGLHLEVRQD